MKSTCIAVVNTLYLFSIINTKIKIESNTLCFYMGVVCSASTWPGLVSSWSLVCLLGNFMPMTRLHEIVWLVSVFPKDLTIPWHLHGDGLIHMSTSKQRCFKAGSDFEETCQYNWKTIPVTCLVFTLSTLHYLTSFFYSSSPGTNIIVQF